mmetsp:Transcript_30515/g.45455  ORF Transcript_30515/g.45455 Transcript_30515/m.45455 type:complete len:84 (-) Transcript_30515:559-810(-)
MAPVVGQSNNNHHRRKQITKKLDQDMNTHFSMPHQEENIRKEISNLSIERANMGNSHDETNDDSSSSDDDDDDAYQNPFSLLM